VLRQTRTAAVARIAAALVAVTLSGAPRALAIHAPVEGHRCTCKAHAGGHHECECAICRKAALRARASDESAPPCHRDAARRALSRSESSGSRDVPCVEGTCGAGERPVTAAAGVEPFCIPAQRPAAIAGAPEAREIAAEPVHDRPLEPETPPPKAA
jgi:hypothetical protein